MTVFISTEIRGLWKEDMQFFRPTTFYLSCKVGWDVIITCGVPRMGFILGILSELCNRSVPIYPNVCAL